MLPTSCKNFRLIAFKLGHGRFKMGNTFLHNKNKICFLKKKKHAKLLCFDNIG